MGLHAEEKYTKTRYVLQLQFLVDIFAALSNDKLIKSNILLEIFLCRFETWANLTLENNCDSNYRNNISKLVEILIEDDCIELMQLRFIFKNFKEYGDESILHEVMKRVSFHRHTRNIELFRFLYVDEDATYKVFIIRF